MPSFRTILPFASLLPLAFAQACASSTPTPAPNSTIPTTSDFYYLKTALKSGQTGKEAFDNLYVTTYHTGAGLNDAVLTSDVSGAAAGFLLATNVTTSTGQVLYDQVFNLSTAYDWGFVMQTEENSYQGWTSVQVNAGSSDGGFYFNSTGLEWDSAPDYPGSNEFSGWLVCNWWYGVPQLFYHIFDYGSGSLPSSCADVYLLPEIL